MRIEGSERHTTRHQRRMRAASDARPAAGTGSVGGGDSVPALDSVLAAGSGEATHVDGGSAARPISFAPPVAVETISLAVGTGLTFPDACPTIADTLPGTVGSPIISLLTGRENAGAIASLRADPVAAPTPAGWPDNSGLVGQDDTAGTRPAFGPEARQVTWTDPASVEGVAVLAIGAATLVLSDVAWWEGEAAAP